MKFIILLIFIIGCQPLRRIEPRVNECVIGPQMDVLKLLRADDEKYMFVEYPYAEDSPVEIIEDVSALKKVECPE
jgi:hypothetical protein